MVHWLKIVLIGLRKILVLNRDTRPMDHAGMLGHGLAQRHLSWLGVVAPTAIEVSKL